MATNSATVVAASLDSSQLEASINSLVNMVAEKTKAMADNFTSEVGRMEQAVKNLGNIKIDSGGAADSSISKQTKAQSDATQATDRRVQKEKELNMTLDQGGDILQKVARYASEVRLPDAAKSARESFQAFYKGFNEQARQIEPLIQSWEKLLQARHTGNIEQVAQKIAQVKHEIAELVKEQANLSKSKPQGYMDEIAKRNPQIKALRDQLVSLEAEQQKLKASDPFKDNPYLNALRERLAGVNSAMRDTDTTNKRLTQTTNQLTDAQKKAIDAQTKLFYARTMRIPTDQYDMQIAKLERVQALLERQRRGDTSFTPAQLAGLEKEERTLLQLIGQVNSVQQQVTSSTQQTVQQAQRYTDEIHKQAAAIRATKEWQEKGYYRIGEASFYNPETSRLAKKDIISLEEQILRWKQKQNEETDKTTRSEYQYSEAVRSAADALRAQLHGTKAASIEVGGRTIYNEKEAGSIESQLTALMKDRTKEFNLQHEVALAIEQDEKRISEELLKQRQTSDGAKKTKEAETYRQMIAKTLGIQESQVKLANAETASYEQLDATLKQLIRTKNRLGSEGLNSAFGKGLLEDIKEVEAAMQRIKKFGYNKVSLSNALGLSEKSLDDIARKSQQLQYVMRNVDITTEEGALAFQRASLNARLLKERENELLGKNNQLMNSNNSLIKSNTELGRSWNYMKNRLAFYFTVGASTQFVKNLIDIRSQYEMNERALGILVNSAERGTQIFNELSKMALVSPYTLIELSSAAKQLTAYDVAAKDVVDTTRRLADMASAVGVPMERLTYALGQIKAYGYLNSRDNRMFANAGIPLVKQLADYYTELEGRLVSTADVYDRIKKKAVGYNEVMDVINRMTDEGGRFFNFQEKMSGTLKVQLANLTLAWNNMLNEIGASQQGVLTTGIGAMKNLFLAWKDLGNVLTTVALTFGLVRAQMLFANVAIGKSNVDLLRYIANNKAATWADYTRALQTKKLTAAQASWLVMSNQTNNALAASVIRMKVLDAATVRSIRNLNGLSLAFAKLRLGGIMTLAGISKAFRSLGGILSANAPLLFITGIIDAFTHLNNVADANKDFNKNIANGAKEASKALSDFLKEEDKVQARAKAQSNNLSQSEASKTWDALREQIELSSLSAKQLIPDLLKIPDINERITAAFDLAERIQDAINKLSDLEDELSVNQDSWLWGLFGEGLAEDIEDYTKRRKELHEQAEFFAKNELNWWEELKIAARGVWDGIGQGAGKEAFDEITEFANKAAGVIKQRLGEDGVKDAEKVGEAIARVMAEVEKNPKISGAGKSLFESRFVEIMGSQFEGVFDIQKYYYTVFLEQLKRDYSNTFRGVTDDIIDNAEHKWNPAQIKAIEETAAKIKKDMPQASRDAIDEIISQLNEKSFKLHFVATFSMERSELQKQFDKSFGDPTTGGVNGDYRQLRPKENEDFLDYRKNLNKTLEEGKKRYAELKLEADANRNSNKALAESLDEEAKKQNNVNKAAQVVKNTWHLLNEEKERSKAQKQAESELAKALKDELKLIETVRSAYKDLTKEGASHNDAVEKSVSGYKKSVANINAVLNKYGIGLDLSKFAGISNPHELQKMLREQLNALVGKAKPTEIQALEVELKKVDLDVDKYDLTKITKGLNNELDRLKDEYELAVSLDADPELGNVFADMMGINIESLPHTVKEYADEYSKYLNKYLKGKNSALQFTGDELRSLTRDDITAFREQVDAGSFNQEWFDAILKAYEDISGKRKKDLEETEKWKNGLIEKYGNLQDKLTKIYKDSVQNQVNAVKTFGTEDQKSNIVRLQLRLEATDNPAELSEINTEIAKIVKDVIDKNPIALKLVTASNNQTKADTSKAYWEDFKNSELYAMTFEDMANNSTRAIQLIIDKLNELKDKVKEDPASMKALIKSLEDAENELNSRDPFAGIVNSIKNWSTASEDAKVAQEELRKAEQSVAEAQSELDDTEDGTPEEQALAQKKLTDAIQRRGNAEAKVVQMENKAKKAQEQLKNSLQNLSNELGNVSGLLGSVSQIFRAVGDDDTADAIDAINEGFTIMTTVIMGVVAALVVLESSNPWLLAIAAALSVIVGLVSFLSGNSNKKITKQVEESERAVKQLELAYVDLQQAVDKAYGTAVIGAKQAALANKELQLAEIQRQIQLEKSRSSKNRDEDKIIDLQKQYKELFYEIRNGYTEIVDDLMGTDVGSFAENLVSSMIAAFKQGEDYMKVFSDSFDEMIDNMIMKSIVSRVVSQYLDAIWEDVNKHINERTKEESEDAAKAQNEAVRRAGLSNDEARQEIASLRSNGLGEYLTALVTVTQRDIDDYKKAALDEEKAMQARLKAASAFTGSDVDYVMQRVTEIMPELGQKLKDILGEYYKFGESSETQLSALQQGIQGITEDTAGAIEAYMNGVSQQVYLHSDLLTQIRDAVVGFSLDVQVATMSQILLQLQQSYAVQMSIESILTGWSSPSGLAVRVEMQ